jgi:TolB-like protein
MLRPDADVEFLSFSLPDAVLSSLAGIQSLVVRSTLAGTKYVGDVGIDLRKIAAEAGVDAVLCGTLLRAGGQIRVNAQLLEASSGTILWSKTIQIELKDIFEVQDQLARAIVESLSIPLSAGDQRRLRRDLPASARAYEFYLRANQLAHDSTMMPVAGELYRSALAEDPDFAPAWARLGRVYRIMAKYGSENVDGLLQQAEHAFKRSLELNPDLSIAHNHYTNFEVESLGRAKEAMARLLTRARSQAADPDLFAGLVLACRFCGLLDASLAADRQARRLDPNIRTSVMYTHFMRGDWERAIESDNEQLEWVRNWTLPLLGRADEAIASYRRIAEQRLPRMIVLMMDAGRHVLEGKGEEALKTIREFTARPFDPEGVYFLARNLVRLDEHSLALELLERLVKEGFFAYQILLRDPWLDPIRGERRFNGVVASARERSQDAEAEFNRLGGDRLLANV